MKPQFRNIKIWLIRNKSEAFFLFFILLIGSTLRLYKIAEYMTFLGDEGRDAIIVRRFLTDFDLILVGPGTSIGNMYLGPLYYYLSAPFLLLANFSPVGPSVMVALFGILTLYFVWHATREWFPSTSSGQGGKYAAVMAAALYAVSPVVITYSRSSWNPNIMPFFALLSIYSIWRVWRYNEMKWLLILGVSLAFALQSHYLALLLLPTLLLFYVLSVLRLRVGGLRVDKTKAFVKYSVVGFTSFLFLMSPLVIFDARHGWRNFGALKLFFTERQTTVSARPWTAVPKLWEIWVEIVGRLLTGFNENLAAFFAVFLGASSLANLTINLKKIKNALLFPEKNHLLSSFLLVVTWLFVTLIGFGVYKQEIYDHYYGIIFPALFILFAAIMQLIFNKNKFVGSLLTLMIIPVLIYANLNQSFLKYPPNRQLQRTETIAKNMMEESGGREFNLAVIAERNYEGAYQYFLEKESALIVMIDPQRADETITEQLFVVCELPAEKCDPTHDPKAGIANFGWSKIEGEWEVEGVILYKLVHYEEI